MAKIRKTGNVVVVSISPVILKASGLKEGDEVMCVIENGEVVIRKVV